MMSIKIVTTFENAKDYMLAAERGETDIQELWQKYMIEPYWADIAKWAPFDQSFKQPPCVREIAALKEQLAILSEVSLDDLESEFQSIVNALPSGDDDDTMLVVLYPLCDSNKTIKERQNGVVGTTVFGNMIISINPLADNYLEWIPYVFAHEYHHNVWGFTQYVVRGGKDCDGSFLEYMITEGQADLFAESLFPGLVPQWNRPFSGATEAELWTRFKPVLFSNDPQVHSSFMFGDAQKGLPWCAGYSFGRAIVADYMNKHPDISFMELIDVPARKILEAGRFSA